MSGANGQPWDFIVVKDATPRKAVSRLCGGEQRLHLLDEAAARLQAAPSLLQMTMTSAAQHRTVSLVDRSGAHRHPGRRPPAMADVQSAHTFGRDQSHLTDGLANTSMMMHLAAAALGLGSQHVTIHIQEPFKTLLGVPTCSPSRSSCDRPSACRRRKGVRRPLADMVHQKNSTCRNT